MEIFVDVDNTLCRTEGSNYQNSVPIVENIEKVNRLYEAGHKIVIWTARGKRSGKNWEELTKAQLEQWKVKFHEARFDKPAFDLLIDDKVLNSADWDSEEMVR